MRKNAILFSAGEYQNSKTFPKPTCDLSGVKVDILDIEKRLKQIGFDVTKKENINNEIGACVYFKSFGLRIAKKSDGKISRIEVIRAIH